MNDVTSKGIDLEQANDAIASAKPKWEKPEVTDFQPVTVSRGMGVNPGDGFANLT